MQIILVHPGLRQARTLNIGRRTLAGLALAMLLALGAASGLLSYVTLHHVLGGQLPFLERWLPRFEPETARTGHEALMRQNIDAMAVRLGEMQARLARLDALGERVATMAGLKMLDLGVLAVKGGRGGPVPADGGRALTLDELTREIDRTADAFVRQDGELGLLESELLYREVSARLVPSAQPLADALVGSRFGARIDPFSGRRVAHEGLDFAAPVGAPIPAAAAGVVVVASRHPGYGNRVDIDHGNGLVTRYAHASEIDVAEGEIVRQGQKIAEVGSTGRSTGPHLHFEVRVDGAARDPLPWLRAGMRAPGTPPLARAR
ncbi:MAG: M23 family metallopeptidase [Burkholderiaceae bacterium]|nr:M23 family metallopeptidase [Burkholderiaceae bacterium]